MAKPGPGQEQKVYEVITQEDENGDLLIPIPEEVLRSLGWKEGMEVEIDVDTNGNLYLKRK